MRIWDKMDKKEVVNLVSLFEKKSSKLIRNLRTLQIFDKVKDKAIVNPDLIKPEIQENTENLREILNKLEKDIKP